MQGLKFILGEALTRLIWIMKIIMAHCFYIFLQAQRTHAMVLKKYSFASKCVPRCKMYKISTIYIHTNTLNYKEQVVGRINSMNDPKYYRNHSSTHMGVTCQVAKRFHPDDQPPWIVPHL